jgi:hypothetical protein
MARTEAVKEVRKLQGRFEKKYVRFMSQQGTSSTSLKTNIPYQPLYTHYHADNDRI